MQYEKVADKMGTWGPVLRKFIESPEFDQIFATLKSCTQNGKEIYPLSPDLFRSLASCDRQLMKAIVITGGPYTNKLHDTVVASGIPFDSSRVKYEQSALYTFWQGYEKDYGFDPDNDLSRDLSYLLQEEHVLLIGSSLTVEAQKAESHAALYEPFWKYMIEEVINTLYRGLPIVLVGASAAKLEKYITPMLHHVLKVEDPVVAVQYNRPWKSDGMFSWVNRILAANNTTGYQNEIQWVRKKTTEVTEKIPWDTTDENNVVGDMPWQKKQ